ncbi:ABC transporter permease DevC [Neosynechococcus sphagnicola]
MAAPSTLGTARMTRLLIQEGSNVQANQIIAIMDAEDRLQAAVLQAKAQVKAAASRLAQVQAGAKQGDILAQRAAVARWEAELQTSQREYERFARLYENGATSASELDRRQLAMKTTLKQLEQAKKVLSSVAEVRPTDVQQAEAEVEVAIANLNHAKAELDTAYVRSPIVGQVLKIHTRPGEIVGNDGIAEIGSIQQMYVVAEVYETDIARVQVGQQATITSHAFSGEIKGVVAEVGREIRKNDVLNTDPAADTDTRVVEVRIRLQDSRKVAALTNLQVDVVIRTPPAMTILGIPLAWLQLTREKMRLLIALAGIGFAVILMFMQLGFRDALFISAVRLHEQLQGDIFFISPQSTALIAMRSFPQRRLYQALGFAGVQSVSPVYLDFGIWRNPENRRPRQLLVIGIDPDDRVFDLPGVQAHLDQIKLSDVVLFDAASRAEFGPIPDLLQRRGSVVTEVSGRRVTVGGTFTLGASFGADGNLITSDLNFLRIFDRRRKGLIDVGLVRLQPGADVTQVLSRLRSSLPQDVRILSRQEFINFERSYWETSTAIGFIFSLGTAMGFIVGTVIVYQILYTDVSDHLPEYATLKAMGYTSFYLLSVVFQEALILSILGYIPGFALCLGLYDLTRNATSLPVSMTVYRSITVMCLTVLMCLISGAIAVRKVQAADPADIF